MPERFKVYIDKNDWWVGVYRGPNTWYVCLLPTVVLRLRRHVLAPRNPHSCDPPHSRHQMKHLADDSVVRNFGFDRYWVNDFETAVAEVGARAAAYEIEENDGSGPLWWLPAPVACEACGGVGG